MRRPVAYLRYDSCGTRVAGHIRAPASPRVSRDARAWSDMASSDVIVTRTMRVLQREYQRDITQLKHQLKCVDDQQLSRSSIGGKKFSPKVHLTQVDNSRSSVAAPLGCVYNHCGALGRYRHRPPPITRIWCLTTLGHAFVFSLRRIRCACCTGRRGPSAVDL